MAAVRAAVTRRANRRIIMRQVGDRLIPVGVTSGRVHAITPEEGQSDSNDNGGSRRSRRRQAAQTQEFNQFLGSMGLGGQDLEEVSCPTQFIHLKRCLNNSYYIAYGHGSNASFTFGPGCTTTTGEERGDEYRI